jgi:hypothetical protein
VAPASTLELKELDEFLLARAMEHDSPTLLFRLACEYLISAHVIRPVLSTGTKPPPAPPTEQRRRADSAVNGASCPRPVHQHDQFTISGYLLGEARATSRAAHHEPSIGAAGTPSGREHRAEPS